MQELLEAEGIKVIDNRVADFERLFWMPDGFNDEKKRIKFFLKNN